MPTAPWSRKNGLRNSPVRSSRIAFTTAPGGVVPSGVSRSDLRGDGRDFGARLRHRNTVAQSADDHHGPPTRSIRWLIEGGRHKEIGLYGNAVVRRAISGWQNAHDPHTAAIEFHGRTHHGFGAAKYRTPERIADQRHIVLARQSLVRKKGAATKSLNARDIEEVGRHLDGSEM